MSLIVGARPVFAKNKPFPVVPLRSGSWRVVAQNVETTKIELTILQPTACADGMAIVKSVKLMPQEGFLMVVGPVSISAVIVEGGREQFVSLYAEPINAS